MLLASYWDAGYIQMDVNDPANPTLHVRHGLQRTSDPLTGLRPAGGQRPPGRVHATTTSYIVTGEEDFAPYRLTEVDGRRTRARSPADRGRRRRVAERAAGRRAQRADGLRRLRAARTPTRRGDTPTPVPDAETTFPRRRSSAGEERILVVQRGPDGDTDEDYDGDGDIDDADDACFPGDKADNAADAGWDAILIVNRHFGDGAADDAAYCGSGGYTQFVVTACTTHEAGHEIFDDPADVHDAVRRRDASWRRSGRQSPHKLDADRHVRRLGLHEHVQHDARTRTASCRSSTRTRSRRRSTRTTRSGFGDLSIHEQATDPTEPLTYSVVLRGRHAGVLARGRQDHAPGRLHRRGRQQLLGRRAVHGAGRRAPDRGLRPRLRALHRSGTRARWPAKRPACTDSGAMVPFKGSATVPLTCTDANGNPLTTSRRDRAGAGHGERRSTRRPAR